MYKRKDSFVFSESSYAYDMRHSHSPFGPPFICILHQTSTFSIIHSNLFGIFRTRDQLDNTVLQFICRTSLFSLSFLYIHGKGFYLNNSHLLNHIFSIQLLVTLILILFILVENEVKNN